MKLKITEDEYYTLRKALGIANDKSHGVDNAFATNCFLLRIKIEKAKNYSKSNIRTRGILRRKDDSKND